MKKLLYVTANDKAEADSVCKTVAKKFIKALSVEIPDLRVEELDLYASHIPKLKASWFEAKSRLLADDARRNLPESERQEIALVEQLCDSFCAADIYVLAAPMWNLSFPSVVKEWLDCVVQTGKTVRFEGDRPRGLLGDKPRAFVYVQSSGARIPRLARPVFNKGLNYVHDIVKTLGVSRFEEILADGTGTTELERLEALRNAESKIETVVQAVLS